MLRAVIYARCSTEEESQKDALVKQVAEAKECVSKNGWVLVDSYVESRSGTSTKGRLEYNRLYDDLLSDKFDIIVIKSQDRLMRNTKDWYLFVDRLSTSRKKLYIYIERKFYTTDDALITGIKAILAEDYSRELSKKINNAHKHRQEKSGTPILTKRTYGFRVLSDKSVVLIEEEAAVKRKMYELCAAGYGMRTIAVLLDNEGILNRNGKPFTAARILDIIRNPMNKGVVTLNKTHYDFESKSTHKNPPSEHYIYEHKVPETVSEELWERANKAIDQRTMMRKTSCGEEKGGKNPGVSMFSGKIICGLCGAPYYRQGRALYKGEKKYDWKCSKYIECGRSDPSLMRAKVRNVQPNIANGCNNIHLEEQKFIALMQQICNERYSQDKSKIIHKMVEILKATLQQEDMQSVIDQEKKQKDRITQQMSILLDKLLDGTISDAVYTMKQAELQKNLDESQEKIQTLEKRNAQRTSIKERISIIEKHLQTSDIFGKASLAGMMDEIDGIVIYPTYMEIHFNVSKMIHIEGISNAIDPISVLRIEYGDMFNYRQKKKTDRNVIVEMILEKPTITAKEIAEELGCSLSGANYKLRKLKEEGIIYFEGKGGKGHWAVKKNKNIE